MTTASSDKEESSEREFEKKSWRRVTVILEAMQDKKKIRNYAVVLPVVFKILARLVFVYTCIVFIVNHLLFLGIESFLYSRG